MGFRDGFGSVIQTLWDDSRGKYAVAWRHFSDGQDLGLKVDQEFYLGHGSTLVYQDSSGA